MLKFFYMHIYVVFFFFCYIDFHKTFSFTKDENMKLEIIQKIVLKMPEMKKENKIKKQFIKCILFYNVLHKFNNLNIAQYTFHHNKQQQPAHKLNGRYH